MTSSGTVAPAGQISGERSARTSRRVVLASADLALRSRIAATLSGMRWEVSEAAGGAELFAQMESAPGGTILLDSWLPDLEVAECVRELSAQYPGVDILAIDGTDFGAAPAQGAYRNEVLHALNRAQQVDQAAWSLAPAEAEILSRRKQAQKAEPAAAARTSIAAGPGARPAMAPEARPSVAPAPLPELLGTDPRMLEVARRIRLVAPRSTAVLVQGPTGTGKELVARALHRLSPRAARPFVALNCAAIPEALLEAELFGHTRGAFTGAVQGRIGRLEAAHGGTLFLDEIGELPLALQAKLLRFIECGELQRVGENEPVRVDVRIIAATHRKLGQMASAGTFRADLYYRLSVFLIQTPALAGRAGDIAVLTQHALGRLAGRQHAAKTITAAAMQQLVEHAWPGNVRELEHTLERAWILSEDKLLIGVDDIDFGELVEG
jgi:DNA-binding NtrC family response regulator